MNGHVILPKVVKHLRTEELLGAKWLEGKTDKVFKSLGIKNKLHPGTIGQTFETISHPLVYEEYDRIRSQGGHKIFIGTDTPIADYLEIDLAALSKTSLPKDIAKRLRDEESYRSTRYELQIAAGFIRLGPKLLWLDYSTSKHPEFFALAPGTDVLTIECKHRSSRDGYEQEADNFWKHFQYELRTRMVARSLNYWVKLTGRDFHLTDHIPLIQQIIALMKESDFGHFQYMNGRYSVQYQKLAEPGNSISADVVNMYPRGDYGINAGQYKRGQIMVGPLYDPILIRMELIDDPEHRIKGIKRILKKASKQFHPGLPNLVYIDINLPDYTQEQEEIPSMVEAITTELCSKHRNISVVVITNIYPVLSLDNYIGFRVRTETILHPAPIQAIPNSSPFPGDAHNTMWIPGKITILKMSMKLDNEHTRKRRKLYGH